MDNAQKPDDLNENIPFHADMFAAMEVLKNAQYFELREPPGPGLTEPLYKFTTVTVKDRDFPITAPQFFGAYNEEYVNCGLLMFFGIVCKDVNEYLDFQNNYLLKPDGFGAWDSRLTPYRDVLLLNDPEKGISLPVFFWGWKDDPRFHYNLRDMKTDSDPHYMEIRVILMPDMFCHVHSYQIEKRKRETMIL